MIQENVLFRPLIPSFYFAHIALKKKNTLIFLHQNPAMSMSKTVRELQDSICRI